MPERALLCVTAPSSWPAPSASSRRRVLAKVAEKIVYASREYEVGMIVIGLPKNMDGS